MDSAVEILDLRRIFLGDLPWTFTAEIVLRTVIIYLYTLLMIRLIGKRAVGPALSPFDFVIIIALGSAVGDPMFYADVPLLHGMVVVTMIVVLERGLAFLVNTSETVEVFVEGSPQRLVVDGRMDLEGMRSESISREELFAILRESGVEQLGQVKRAYIEQSGAVSVFLFSRRQARPGLPLIPPWDIDRPDSLAAGEAAPEAGEYACVNCGETASFEAGERLPECANCEGTEWVPATKYPIEAYGEAPEEPSVRRRKPNFARVRR